LHVPIALDICFCANQPQLCYSHHNVTALHLETLGHPRATINGARVQLGVKSVALLTYLAIEGTTKREIIARLLWPNSKMPRNNLSQERNALSVKLGWDALEGDADVLGLNKNVSCDAGTFREYIKQKPEDGWRMYQGQLLENL
jgi:DNA-binding SARP family transcriptional activator